VVRYEGIQHLPEMTDTAFEAARTMYLASRGFVLVHQSTLSSDPSLKNFHFSFDRNREASTACHDLAALLGQLYRLARQARSAEGPLPLTKAPQWQEEMFALIMQLGKVSATRANADRVIQQMYRIVDTAEGAPAGDKEQARHFIAKFHSLTRASKKRQMKTLKALGKILFTASPGPKSLKEAIRIVEG
jgi:hypothetical protein